MQILAGFADERDSLPLAGSTLCIGDNDTCIMGDSTGHITVDFPLADSARMLVTAKGFSDTVFTFDSCFPDTATLEMVAVRAPVSQEHAIRIEEPCGEVVVVAGRIRRSEETYRQSMVAFQRGT